MIKRTIIQLIKSETAEIGGTYFERLMFKLQTPYYLINISDWENPVVFKEAVEKGAFYFNKSTIVLTELYPMLFSKQSKRLTSDILTQLSYGQNKVFIMLSDDETKSLEEEAFIKKYIDSMYN